MRYFLILITVLSFQNSFTQSIIVDENYTPQQLVENILINSGCASITNVVVSGGNYPTGEKTYGYFNNNGSSFPINEGIILSTGKINNAPGPNNSLLDDGGDISWQGDNDLNTALNLSNSINATVLEFDFVPLGSQISFDFLLSSEQYLTNPSSNQCNYTDGFAFLLREVGSTNYQNLALVPGTTIPIKINTIRGSGTICPAANEQYFDAFNGINYPTNFNGQTKVLTAQSNVTPGTPYHIKLVIADEGNYRYDSAIFLKGGSFNTNVNLGDDRTVANGNPVCSSFDLNTSLTGNHKWFLNGNEIIGETNSTLTVTQSGIYSVEVTIPGCTSSPTDEIVIEFAPTLIQSSNNTFPECDADAIQDGITTFDLSAIIPILFTNLPANYQISLFESPMATSALPLTYQNTIPYQQTLYAKVTNISNCYDTVSFPITLIINTFTEDYSNETIGICENNSIILDAGNGFLSYSWNTNPIQTSQTIIVTNSGNYSVTLENALGCFKTKTFNVVGSEIATILDIEINDFAQNNSATIIVTGDGLYEYSLNGLDYQNSNIFENLTSGEYTVYVNDKNGCGQISKSFYILDFPKFFTPNGDGYNDTWQIKNLNKQGLEDSAIYIFDRYGKLIKQISPLSEGWNGIYNGNLLPSSDYWFVLEKKDGSRVRSHFTLKR
ncbi:T9SS type B sorting domain-containing protein [Flavobacterium jejuense]|uniref:T9SS type B sorting domain-containing protein n=1 Tax=Flavobacterium jejuense TaxID=1544455 RepID=A0ABX0IQ80_9FLAO|nr:choice-of-anchor L domain-containing protein [Flavobacterium jejuense]NHN24628.1 T9SS type B sorting domain-containing protein [Flavobacterium jejuense]